MEETTEKAIESKIEKKKGIKEKIKFWFKDSYNIILIGIIIFAIAIRVYYFPITQKQGLWWDESEYLSTAATWSGQYNWWQPLILRPPLFPLIMTGFFYFGIEEIGTRILVFLLSIFSILLVYLIGKLFFNREIGLMAAAMLSFFWSFLFYTFRLLTDVPLTFLLLSTIYLFFSAYYGKGEKWRFILGGIFLTLSFLMKFSTGILIIGLGFYVLVTERKNLLSLRKNLGIYLFFLSSLITVLPFFVWQKIQFGNYLAFFNSAIDRNPQRTFFESLKDQTIFSLSVTHSVIYSFFLIGMIILLFNLILRYHLIFKKEDASNKYLFLFIWIVFSLLFFGKFNYGEYMEERYYFVFYPAIFLITSYSLYSLYTILKKYGKILSILVLSFLILVSGFQNISYADDLIKIKTESFKYIRSAGEWIRDNSNQGDNILTTDESTSYFYFSRRNIIAVNNLSHLEELINSTKPKYVVISFYYAPNFNNQYFIELVNKVFNENQRFKMVKSFGPTIDAKGKIPIVSIFEINSSWDGS